MAKERLFELQETKGSFQLSGVVTGTESEKFYKEGKTSTGKDKRSVNFGVSATEGTAIYVGLDEYPQENVFFSKRTKSEDGKSKTETEKVAWANRMSFKKEGFKLIGVNLGLEKTVDEKGNTVNLKKTLVGFDACKEIGEKLVDGVSVFTKGTLDFSSFTDDKGNIRHFTKIKPNQISLCKDVDFTKEDYKPIANFEQVIIFMKIEQEMENDVATGRGIVSAKIVTYSTIEDAEFIVENVSLIKALKTLKPYTAIKVHGDITQTVQAEEVETDNVWGEANPMQKIQKSSKREFIITGATPDTIDTTTYTKALIEDAEAKIAKSKQAKNDFAEASDTDTVWGNSSPMTESDNDDDPWS